MNREPAPELTVTVPAPTSEVEGPWDPNVHVQWEQLPPPAPPSQRRRRRWRLVPRTLSNRLVLGVVSLVTVLVLGIGLGSYVALKFFLMHRLDQQLETTARSSLVGLLRSQNGPSANMVGSPQIIWVAQLDAAGNVLDSVGIVGTIRHLDLPPASRVHLASPTAGPSTVVATSGLHVRVISETQPQLEGVVVIGLATSDVTDTLHQLFLIELAIGAGAIALAFVATSYGVRLSLRPLRRVTRTAQDVTAELSPEGAGLDRRVPIAASEVDSEAGQMAESINTLLGAVETQFAARVESERRMRQFLADASHELRTPLTSIRGYAELSRMRRVNNEPIDDADTLQRIESEGTRMSRLVEDLLLLARSDQGAPLQYESIDVGELVEDAVEGARAAHPHRRIDAIVPVSLHVLGDQDQLLRVVRNLITNAAIHTAPAGTIHVSAAREAREVVLRVADDGPGLPPEEAAHVFERFWRADKARTRARGGSGLGLSIVSAIVAAHGGTVSFDSSLVGGSTVTVRLPA
jgi:two-component system OmpR family sensor kinase